MGESSTVSLNLRLEEVPALLDLCYEMRLKGYERCTPHLIGPPGIGKSTIVQEWSQRKAEELGLKWHDYDELSPQDVDRILQEPDKHFIFADKRLTNMDPTDFGIPRDVTINGKKFIRYLPMDLAILLHYSPGVLFLDEFSNESRPNMVACLPPGEPILGMEPKAIEGLNFGNVVLSHDGFATVTGTSVRNFHGELYEIKALGILPLRLTPEHPVLVAEVKTKYFRYPEKPYQYGRRKKVVRLRWKRAEDVREGDYLVFPKLRLETYVESVDLSNWNLKARKEKFVGKFPVNEETAQLIGYYVSEGSHQIDFGKDEAHLAENVKKIVNKYPSL